MALSVTRRRRCRLCDGTRLDLALPIAASPIADAYVPAEKLGEEQSSYPLDLYLCRTCGHVQNLDVVDPEILFREYSYVTSSSLGLVEHFRRYADEVMAKIRIDPGSLILEIGSNDGTLLHFFKERGMTVLGVDPARRIAQEATAGGIPTIPEFFDGNLAAEVHKRHGPASIVTANNVFAHADNLAEIVRGIRTVLGTDGIFVFEVSYLVDIVQRFLFDTVYHEHVSYHTIAPLNRLFESHGMQLFDVQRIGSKGGSIRGFVQRRPEGRRSIAPTVGELLELEAELGVSELEIYRKYERAIDLRKTELNRFVDEARGSGKTVAGYGASATVTTLIWHFGLMHKLDFLVDDNPAKHGLFSPGSHIPVFPSEEIYDRRPDVLLVLAWNYADPIVKRHQRFLDEGGKFVIPLPKLRFV